MNKIEAVTRAEALVSQMTLDEKLSQILYTSASIDRMGIHSCNWWNEALHGAARAGLATVFPQAIGFAATFNKSLILQVADVTSTEVRAKYNVNRQQKDRGAYKGLTLWSPNINIFRDPRWGRGHETYGEDPYLTAMMGEMFVKGLQGDGEYMKTAACAKHYAVHSGPENMRHEFNAEVNKTDLFETYLPAFEHLVKEAKVAGVMGAYNRINGEPACGSEYFIETILRQTWGFDGYFVSDCGAIADFHTRHLVTKTPAESAALAMNSGCDLNCGNTFGHMLVALKEGLVEERSIDQAVVRLLSLRIQLGEFESTPYDQIPFSVVDCIEHQELNLKTAGEAIVLLKNKDNILPMNPQEIKTIAVIGPNARSIAALEGNYCGTASRYVTIVDGVQEAFPNARLYYSQGSHLYRDRVEFCAEADDRLSEARTVANLADVIILCVGLDPSIEGEEGDASNEYASGDKHDLLLPECQRKLVKTVCSLGKKVIIVTLAGSAIDLMEGNRDADAILHGWYPGALGGRALAHILTGEIVPSGKLPVTFYSNDNYLPAFDDYAMKNRTYKFMTEKPLYPFGYGLCYTQFLYSNLQIEQQEIHLDESARITVDVTNIGDRSANEVIQVYIKQLHGTNDMPRYSLCSFEKIYLNAKETKSVALEVSPVCRARRDENGGRYYEAGDFQIFVGGNQPDERSIELGCKPCLCINFSIK